jgi:hypothetical protein
MKGFRWYWRSAVHRIHAARFLQTAFQRTIQRIEFRTVSSGSFSVSPAISSSAPVVRIAF